MERLIRVSIGTAGVLGLRKVKMLAYPTTAYLMTYSKKKCTANCAFCTQARDSKKSANYLSRVLWPPYPITAVVAKLKDAAPRKIKRICFQTINVPELREKLLEEVKLLKDANIKVPISVAIHPVSDDFFIELKNAGVDTVGVSIDAATPEIFNKVKGSATGSPYTWDGHINGLIRAQKIFGTSKVSTHLIIGLGETEEEAVKFIQKMKDMKIIVALFALTPMKGTQLENAKPPSIGQYRRTQLARFLIFEEKTAYRKMKFNARGQIIDFGLSEGDLKEIIEKGVPFMTSGCPHCNRPYYNEDPRGIMYNFPFRPNQELIKKVFNELKEGLKNE